MMKKHPDTSFGGPVRPTRREPAGDGSKRADLASDEAVGGRSGLSLNPDKPAQLVFNPEIRVQPHITAIMQAGYVVVHGELMSLARKVLAGEELCKEDSEKMGRLIRALTELSREERRQLEAFDINVSDDDLDELRALLDERDG